MFWEFSKSHSVLCDLLPPLSPASSGLFPVLRASQMSRIHTCRPLYLNAPPPSVLAKQAQSACHLNVTLAGRSSLNLQHGNRLHNTYWSSYPTTLNYPLHFWFRVINYLSST